MDADTQQYIAAQFGELRALILQMGRAPEPAATISPAEIMRELGLQTRHGLMKWTRKYKLRSIARGVYRMDDYRAAKALAALSRGNGVRIVRKRRAKAQMEAA